MNSSQNIHLIFKTHLDVGFTDFASRVILDYFTHHIPSALRVAREMRESGSEERFIWTTGSYLIYEYLEQVDADGRREMENAILAGDIKWHAIPFTTHTELEDPDLFRFGLSLSQELDKRFGTRTIAAKMTDVPGHTRGIVPLLAEAGVRFLHIGVNPGSTVPSVPPLFRWMDPSGADLVVMYESGYGSAFTIEGSRDSIAFGHTIDNLGPQSAAQVMDVYREVRILHPGAHVFASTLDAFAQTLEALRSSLPVVTGEISDTWIHGVGSDPVKVARFRELLRLRSKWLSDGRMKQGDPRYQAFNRKLMLVPEHTWGMDEKTYLGDHEAYNVQDFASRRCLPNFQKFEASWVEKRHLINQAVDALDQSDLADEACAQLESLRPHQPSLEGWTRIEPGSATLEGQKGQIVRFDEHTGAITGWQKEAVVQPLSGVDHSLGWLRYQTFSADDYERFFHQYILPKEQTNDWAREDFTKPGLEHANAVNRMWQPTVKAAYTQPGKVLFHLMAEGQSAVEFGCPENFYLQYHFSNSNDQLEIDLQWFDKQANRMPEALWFSFVPFFAADSKLELEKLGEMVDPLQVVENGNRHLHATSGTVRFTFTQNRFTILSMDAPLVAPGQLSLLDFNNAQPDLVRGVHFNLFNNLWGTNFPMWFEEDCRFRFNLKIE